MSISQINGGVDVEKQEGLIAVIVPCEYVGDEESIVMLLILTSDE